MGEQMTGRRIVVPETRELRLLSAMLAERGAIVVPCPLVAIRARADGRPDAEAPLPVLVGLRVLVGLENVLDGDEPGQLALSMLLAGANQVVASLWEVDSTATAAWNRLFYQSLAAGELPVDAVNSASKHLRETQRWQSPKYWAAFALYQH